MSRRVKASSRAYGSNGGAQGGGYEATNPDYDRMKLLRLRADYLAMDPAWRSCFLSGLSRFEAKVASGELKVDP